LSEKIEPIKRIPSEVDVGREDRNREPKTKEDFRLKLMKEMDERRKRLAKLAKGEVDKEA
jgi:hypothetical protein